MTLLRNNCGRRLVQHEYRKAKEALLSSNNNFKAVAAILFVGIAFHYAENVYAATNDKLDVNLNVLYVGTKSQKDSNGLGEIIVQFPFPLSENARNTGEGPFGGLSYFDYKTLVNVSTQPPSDNTQLVSEMGLGRIYYSTSVPGDTPYTFVPFVTFFRQFVYKYVDTSGNDSQISGNTYMLPGFKYAYRFNEKFAAHIDAELYSYTEKSSNRLRMGFTYSPAWPWIFSASHERLAWDIDTDNLQVDGNSRENNVKIIFRDPPQGNFALTIGYGNQVRNASGSALLAPSSTSSSGTYFGIEASGGVLAW
jgi:hypothetical protein